MRLNCAPLNCYLYRIGVIDSANCSCGLGVEGVSHFFLECPNYAVQRSALERALTNVAPFTISTLLNGVDAGADEKNELIAKLVLKFISESQRFSDKPSN